MRIICDTREQRPYDFLAQGADIEPVQGKLDIGDYSLEGFTSKVAVERKSQADLVQCLSSERDRFERELKRAAALEAFCVVVECDYRKLLSDIEERRGRTARKALSAAAAAASIQAFASRLGTAFFFTGNRANGEAFTVGFLRQYLRGKQHEYEAIQKALDLPKATKTQGVMYGR